MLVIETTKTSALYTQALAEGAKKHSIGFCNVFDGTKANIIAR